MREKEPFINMNGFLLYKIIKKRERFLIALFFMFKVLVNLYSSESSSLFGASSFVSSLPSSK